jgi:hypothetical protein
MSVANNPVAPNASPSDLEAAGVPKLSRVRHIEFEAPSTIAAATLKKRVYFTEPGRILSISSFRRTAASGVGAAGSTDVDVNLNGATILNATIQHENASGDDDHLAAVLKSTHAAYDGYGIAVAVGDYLDVDVDAIEAGATAPSGLFLDVKVLVG